MKAYKRIGTILAAALMAAACLPGSFLTAQAHSNLPLPEDYRGTGANYSDDPVVVRVDEGVLETVVDTRFPQETFSPQDRQYAGISTITATGDRLWATWRTGGDDEGTDNYFPLCYSDDGGKTWVDPYIVIDHPDTLDRGIGVGTPYLWTAPDGKMWLFFLQQGTWAIVFDGADGDLADMTWEIRQIFSNMQISKKPIVIEGEGGAQEWLLMAYSSNDRSTTFTMVSTDGGGTWRQRGEAVSDSPYRKYVESCYVQLGDGSILQMCRLDNGGGGLEVARSEDYGATWSEFECNLDEPYWGPGSKPDILKLSDGGILLVNHDNKNSRSGLTAYLSYDDGETWPYRLTIDERAGETAGYFEGVAYPEAHQAEDGAIYIIYDRDRWTSCEIRLAKITVEDIKAGELTEEGSFLKKAIFKKASYRDIVRVETQFAASAQYALGTSADEIVQGLPTQIAVTDDTGATVTLNGRWSAPRAFTPEKTGEFVFTFSGTLPEGMHDTFGLLTHTVTITQDGPGGSGWIIALCVASVCAVAAVAAVVIVARKKKKDKEETHD